MKEQIKIITLSPAMADRMIKHSAVVAEKFPHLQALKRVLKEPKVSQYATAMKKGLWKLNNDCICLNKDGFLLNANHRLHAVVRSGCTITIGLLTNVPDDHFKTMDADTGPRTPGVLMQMAGIVPGAAKAGIIKNYIQYKKGKFQDRGSLANCKLSSSEIVNFGEKHRNRLHDVYSIANKITKKFPSLSNQYIGALYWTLSDISQDHADSFFQLYSNPIGLTEEHPVLLLRERLIKDLKDQKKYRASIKVAWVLIAWNYFRANKKMKKLVYNPDKMDYPKPI